MLAQHDDQRLVEHPALVQVRNEPREAAVEAGHQFVLHPRVVVPVRVPAGAGQAELVPEHRDEPRPGFDQPAGRQASLAEQRHAIGLARLARFAAEVERLPQLLRAEQRIRPSRGTGRRCRNRPAPAAASFELVQERFAAIEPVERDVRGPRNADARSGESGVMPTYGSSNSCGAGPERLGDLLVGLAVEVGAERVEALPRKAAYGPARCTSPVRWLN